MRLECISQTFMKNHSSCGCTRFSFLFIDGQQRQPQNSTKHKQVSEVSTALDCSILHNSNKAKTSAITASSLPPTPPVEFVISQETPFEAL
jgi:hypothetical protein